MSCPCGSQLAYADCCGSIHKEPGKAQNALSLMKSRFSAFVLGSTLPDEMSDFIIQTQDSTLNSENTKTELTKSFKNTNWVSLNILNHKILAEHNKETVEFVAFYLDEEDQLQQLHELSSFNQNQGQWIYYSGTILDAIKLERNAPCPCLSGKKYKKCHL